MAQDEQLPDRCEYCGGVKDVQPATLNGQRLALCRVCRTATGAAA